MDLCFVDKPVSGRILTLRSWPSSRTSVPPIKHPLLLEAHQLQHLSHHPRYAAVMSRQGRPLGKVFGRCLERFGTVYMYALQVNGVPHAEATAPEAGEPHWGHISLELGSLGLA